jgi:hypothetical protein
MYFFIACSLSHSNSATARSIPLYLMRFVSPTREVRVLNANIHPLLYEGWLASLSLSLRMTQIY